MTRLSKKALDALDAGIESSKQGTSVYLGSFASYSYDRRAQEYARNVATTSLAEARALAERYLEQPVEDVLGSDFNHKYLRLQEAVQDAPAIPRILMPVIEPEDIDLFQQRLNEGLLDIFPPWARGKWTEPEDLSGEDGEWVDLGYQDGDSSDDVVRAKITRIPVKNLRPTQNQIWLEKVFGDMAKHGVPYPGSPMLDLTIIVSSDRFILDGHHRYSQALLANPNLGMRTLLVPLGIDTLLRVGRAYGEAIGNHPNQS